MAETREPDLERLNALIDAAFDAVLRALLKADPYGALDHDMRSAVKAVEDRRTGARKATPSGEAKIAADQRKRKP